jgi:acyl-CoA reductase-like NAD-dependent aldehyde dehydrogenase
VRLNQLWNQLPTDRRQAISLALAKIVARRLDRLATIVVASTPSLHETQPLSPASGKEGGHELS